MMPRITLCSLTILLAAGPGLAGARPASGGAGAYTPLPKLAGADAGLRLAITRYTGGTNGEMIVRVHNPTRKPVAFSAEGLYFVPEGDPEKAPQRLGAAGPFLVQRGGRWEGAESLRVAAKGHAELKLQVFCIDSHRPSPSAEQAFRLGRKRLPKQLRTQIAHGAASAMKKYRAMPAAKGAIQSAVWQVRDAKWIKLDGERKDEKAMKSRPRRRQRHVLERRKILRLPAPRQEVAPRP